VRVGNFVEIKNSTIKQNTKISHLTYIGDATIGSNCNIGCGVVFCNYDGKNKHKTIIGDNVFVGSNVNLIAPITIDNNCFIAAGSTVTKSVSNDTFVIARAKQENKPKR
jgi:bifunctional UDP-N-acetylglucosamine pyrophosphorylase/glucosamine-1-phosphate N-acetyltransferase